MNSTTTTTCIDCRKDITLDPDDPWGTHICDDCYQHIQANFALERLVKGWREPGA
jgi:hypothetical protein